MQGHQGDQRLVAAYPREWELDALLRDGTAVHLRPIRPTDEDALVAFHGRLSPHTIYRRFFSPRPVLPPRDVFRFTNVDYRDRMALVAEIGGELAGVARYDRQGSSEAAEAEVAFVIEDRHQGRGLGSLLLEHLAAAARERDIGFFVAETLAENRAMLGVFRDAGFIAQRSFDAGLVHLRFPIAETDRAREAMSERDRRASVQSMTPLLRPRSVAVVGASRAAGSLGHEIVRNLVMHEFVGSVHPVNPGATAVAGVPSHRSVGDIPTEVDLAIITVPAGEVAAVIEACGRKGVRAVVVVSAGFAETGTPGGRAAQDELVRLARHHGMRLVGPNAMGVITTLPEVSLNATPSAVQPPVGRVALLAQSGGLGLAVLQQAVAQGIGISSFVSVGNRGDVSGNDLLQYWEADAETDVVLLYLETFGNPRKFARIARRVSRSKPIVVVKSGRGGADDVRTDALFQQTGVIRVDTLSELFDVSLVLAHQPLPAGRRLAIVSNAVGPGALAADAATAAGVPLATLEQNPVAVRPGATAEEYRQRLRSVLADSEVDAVLVIGTPPMELGRRAVAAAVAAAAQEHPDKPVIACYLGGLAAPGLVAGTATALHPIPLFPFPEQAVRAFGRVAAHAEWRRAPEGEVVVPTGADVDDAVAVSRPLLDAEPDGRWLTEPESVALLAAVGISVDADRRPAQPAAESVVAVVVGVLDDPSFGPLLSFGLGGDLPELLGDRAYRIVPLTDTDAADLLRSVRLSPLLFGHGGATPVQEAALTDLLLRVSALVEGVPELAELTLEADAGADGVRVVGSRVRLAPPPAGPGPLLRKLR